MRHIHKYKGYILSFLIPLIILFLFFLWKGCFTDKNILHSDMGGQYLSLFQYLKNVLHGTATFPYTFSIGLGGGMYGSLFYYLANPLNLLVYFFNDIPFFLMLLVMLKISLSGLTMYIFLKDKFQQENSKLLIFSLAYALMSYNINYFVNIMWLDGVILAPILLMGIDRILHKKGSLLYIIILFCSIFLNYYIGYILTVFSLIYFVYGFIIQYQGRLREEKKLFIHFIVITFLTGLMTSFILIPCGLELLDVTRIKLSGSSKWINWNFLDFIAPTYIGFGNLENPVNYYGICIFSGTVMIPLVLCYFFNKKISKREKWATAIVYFFFFSPVLLLVANMLWHMFTIPVGFNYRYSFLITLFTIIISYRSLQNLEVPRKVLIHYFIFYCIFSCSLGYVIWNTPDYYVFLNIYKVVVTILLLGLNIFLLFKNKKSCIFAILIFELIVNLAWIGLDSKMVPDSTYDDATEKIFTFSTYCEENKRCESISSYTMNDSLFGNYSGVSVFLSTANSNTISFLCKASNFTEERNFYVYHPDAILDMLLGIEVVEVKKPVYGYEWIQEKNIYGKKLYWMRNPNALSIGYLVSPNLKNFSTSNNGFFYLEDLLNAMDDKTEQYLKILPLKKISEKEYKLEKIENYPYLYLYSELVPTINGEELEDFVFIGDNYGTIYDNYGNSLTFEFEDEPENFEVYTVDMEKIAQFKDSRIELEIDKNTGNKIVGHIDVPSISTLFMSIPYEEGWKVKVDGKNITSYQILDTFLAIDLEEGYHTISLEYHVPGLKAGITVSLVSLLLLTIYLCKNRVIK